MLEYIKIYKNFHKTSEVSQLVNDCDLSMYTLQNFDGYYNSLSKLNDIKVGCEENGIHTLNDYVRLLHNQIVDLQDIFNNRKLNFVENDNLPKNSFQKLDVGRKYLSIDLKHAYSQYIDSMRVFRDKFDDMVFDGLPEFMKGSKKARIFMYWQIPSHGNLKFYLYKLLDKVLESDHKIVQLLKEYNLKVVSYNMDELIYDITDIPTVFDEFIGDHTINGINIHLNTFEQHYISFVDPITKKDRTIPIREYSTHTNFVTNTCVYMNQLHKAYNNLPIVENDLYIPDNVHWNKIIKLDEPIKITEII